MSFRTREREGVEEAYLHELADLRSHSLQFWIRSNHLVHDGWILEQVPNVGLYGRLRFRVSSQFLFSPDESS